MDYSRHYNEKLNNLISSLEKEVKELKTIIEQLQKICSRMNGHI